MNRCDDDNECTKDLCVGEECAWEWTCEDDDPCTIDECVERACVHTAKDCNDDDPCTENDRCDAATGECVSDPKVCEDDGNPCTRDLCDPQTGDCIHPAKADGTPCADDGNVCTNDVCQNGTCVHPAKPDGAPCPDDGDPCTDDICENGECVHSHEPDRDGDDVRDDCDNCPDDYNPDQADSDEDGTGDACECGIVSVQWIAAAGTLLDGNPNPGGGMRVFPDKNSPDDTDFNKEVVVRVHVAPAESGVEVRFVVFDVDDPWADAAPIDDEAATMDNRGYPRLGTLSASSATTNADGIAEVTFVSTMQPGDNFRVAAACSDETWINELQVPQGVNDGRVLYSNGDVVPEGVRITPMLTVWRRLWVERDTMAAPGLYETQVLGTADGIARNTPVDGQSDVDLGQNLSSEFSDLNLYEGGTVVFSNCPAGEDTFPVHRSTSAWLFDDHVIVSGVPGECADGSDYVLSDDDDLQVLPHLPTGGALIGPALAEAYIVPVYAGTTYSDMVAFKMHLGGNEANNGGSWNAQRDLSDVNLFWSVHLVGCWEHVADEDADPDICSNPAFPPGHETATVGTYGSCRSIAMYLQAIADQYACGNTTDEDHAVVHEIGHSLGQQGHVANSIMEAGAPKIHNNFAPQTIAIFRSRQ